MKGWREEGKEGNHEGNPAKDSGRLDIVPSSLFYQRQGNAGFKARRGVRENKRERERMLESGNFDEKESGPHGTLFKRRHRA